METKEKSEIAEGERKANITKKVRAGVLIFFAIGFLFLTCTVIWCMTSFPYVSIPEMLSTVKNLGGAPSINFLLFVLEAIIPTAVIVGIAVGLYFIFRHYKFKWRCRMPLACFLLSLIAVIPSMACFCDYVDLSHFVTTAFASSSFIDEHYVSPSLVSIVNTHPEKKKTNLIFLILESMETTYSSKEYGGYFEENFIPELSQLANEYEDFDDSSTAINGAHCLEYSTWTMAAIFSHYSGLPYKTPFADSNMNEQEYFFPGVYNLGDFLHNEGYDQYFFCGSDAVFGGRRAFFEEHGSFSFRDFPYYNSLPASDPNHVENDGFWGYQDYHLFDYVKDELAVLSDNYVEKGTPFNVTALTVDTHFSGNSVADDGNPCPYCDQEMVEENQYGACIRCSSKQVGNFVDWYFESGEIPEEVSGNTALVIVGDHVTMSGSWLNEAVDDGFDRRTYYCFESPYAEREGHGKREYCAYDTFPTTIAALGYEIEGDRLGLGTNLYSEKETLIEEYGLEAVELEIEKKSETMQRLFEFDALNLDYLNAKGLCPEADVNLDLENGELTISDIQTKEGFLEGFDGACLFLDSPSNSSRLEFEDKGDHYALSLPLSSLAPGGYSGKACLIGSESGNLYKVGSVSFSL